MSLDFWKQLSAVNKLEFTSQCRKIPPSFESRKGIGEVKIQDKGEDEITFFEKGKWQGIHSKSEVAFTNVFRWRLNPKTGLISLDHLRLGTNRPVFLFTLSLVDGNLFKTLQPHECKEDTYFGSVLFDKHYIQLNWRIVGPKKNELLSVVYS
ncbi:MAG: hypothetical protein KR126chlam3_01161 [Chlamydiae bacterium]|nr:hypothetical protein [Chlamydiota bacterium]